MLFRPFSYAALSIDDNVELRFRNLGGSGVIDRLELADRTDAVELDRPSPLLSGVGPNNDELNVPLE